MGHELSKNYSFCSNSGIEDVDVGHCLRKLGVKSKRSIDDYGRERFLPIHLNNFLNNISIDWLYSYAQNPVKTVFKTIKNLIFLLLFNIFFL